MNVQADSDLIEALAEGLYDRSVAGHGRDEAPAWLGCPVEIKAHWRDIARAAITMMRSWDENH